MKKSLIPLALGGFGIGMTEFVMMGILPDVATGLKVTIPEAGHLISAYALGVVIGAPTLVGWLSNRPPRSVLIGFMILFTVFNALSAFAPDMSLLLLCRFLAGLPHGAFFGVGAVVASRLADKGKAAAAVATMLAGLTLANVIGVPLGTYVGHYISWRLVFLIVAVIGLLAIFGLRQWIPEIEANRDASFARDLRIFRRPGLWLAMAITSIGTGGLFAWLSYIAPLLIEVTAFSPDAIPAMMTVVGAGMTAGVLLGGRLADRVQPVRAVFILLASMTALLCLNAWLAESGALMVVLAFVTGANALALGPPIQMLLIRHSQGAEMLGSSLGQSGFNIGNALGAFLGGIPLAMGYAYTSPPWVAACLSTTGLLLTAFMMRRDHASGGAAALKRASS